eukprot:SAG31_NODE_2093_length_6459_cov_3.398585_4_plen_186_part_00
MIATATWFSRFSPLHSHGACPRGTLQVYADTYTFSGCSTAAYCGVFRRVAAHCVSGDRCPGGRYARSGWSDVTLCDGAPAYQREGGDAVLLRSSWNGGRDTQWHVVPSGSLENCDPNGNHNGWYYYSSNTELPLQQGSNMQPSSPDAAGYGWSDPGGHGSGNVGYGDQGTIHIVVGGGGGGGDGG